MTVTNNLRYTFSFSERLHLQKDFEKTMKFGRRLSHPAVFLYFLARNDGSPLRRLGLVTSKGVGTAVKRNRIKRKLREIFRLNKHILKPGIDIVLGSRPLATTLNFAELKEVLLSLFSKAGVLKR